MKISFSSGAVKEFKKLDHPIKKRIQKKMEYWFSFPDPLMYSISLVGYSPIHYRFRIGNYRVVGIVEEGKFVIISVGHRRDIYQ